MYCRICGDEDNVEFRLRSRMSLCNSCHESTPAKTSKREFLATIRQIEGSLDEHQERTLERDFYPDYLTSTYGDVREYWKACSDEGH